MRILVIGGTGLISAPIARFLLDRDDEVVFYNRGQSQRPTPPSVRVIHGDRTDYATFEPQMRAAGVFDAVIDMVGYQPADAESVVRAFQGRTGHYIFCSTVDVYTKPARRYPYREDEPRVPFEVYGQAKVRCEDILLAAHAAGDFPVTIMRPAYTYGYGRGINHSFGGTLTYLDRIRRGKPIVVHGDGNSLTVACHADDVARAFVNAIGNTTAFGRAYHITGEEWLTWNQYHAGVADALDAPPPTLVHIPTDVLGRLVPGRARRSIENYQFNKVFDTTAARTDLGFRYTVAWREGVRRVVDWLDQRGLIPDSDADPFDDQLIATWERLGASLAHALEA